MKHVENRVVLKVTKSQKYAHTFANGQTIQLERDANNLDRKETEQTLGECISAKSIPTGAMVLFSHNSPHPVNEIFDHGRLSGKEIAEGAKIYSFLESDCFLWKMPGDKEWNPTQGFVIAERVFKPYEGILLGIEPTKVKNVLYIKTGELAGKVVRTLHASDYPIVFRNESGVEERIIRCRHFEDDSNEREEIIAIDHAMTALLMEGKLLIGLTPTSARSLLEPQPV